MISVEKLIGQGGGVRAGREGALGGGWGERELGPLFSKGTASGPDDISMVQVWLGGVV